MSCTYLKGCVWKEIGRVPERSPQEVDQIQRYILTAKDAKERKGSHKIKKNLVFFAPLCLLCGKNNPMP